MMWFTADQHWGHEAILRYCNRPFSSAAEMDAELVRRWNEVVKPDDLVFHLGDFALGGRGVALGLMGKLNGSVHLVPGGHDDRWLHDGARLELPTRWYVGPPLHELNLDGWHITLCHYPMLSWPRSHYGQPHLHGHSHGTIKDDYSGDMLLPPGRGMRLDVGVDSWDFYPVSWATIQKELHRRGYETKREKGARNYEAA